MHGTCTALARRTELRVGQERGQWQRQWQTQRQWQWQQEVSTQRSSISSACFGGQDWLCAHTRTSCRCAAAFSLDCCAHAAASSVTARAGAGAAHVLHACMQTACAWLCSWSPDQHGTTGCPLLISAGRLAGSTMVVYKEWQMLVSGGTSTLD